MIRGRFRRGPCTLALATGLGLALALALAWPAPAAAGNEAHVRTPVLWPSQCAVVVERSVDPIVHFDYAIPLEDTELTADELPDSRTHQFIALCRDRALSELLPPWITRDDVERSAAAGLIPSSSLDAAEILDESPSWTDCFLRITADDDRRPITFAQAALGVDWDTSEAAVGVWMIAGHTFEPAFNLWRARPGFVKVVDDRRDPAQDLPAIALLGDEQVVEPGAELSFEACVDVLEPATIELEWAEFAPILVWRPLAALPVEQDGPLALTIPAPVEAADRELLVRARLIDALGRERLAHAPVRLTVLACPESGCPLEEPSTPEPPTLEPEAGCACRVETPNHPQGAGLLLLLLLGLGLVLIPRQQRRPT